MPEPTKEELLIQKDQCPIIRAAYRTGDMEVIRRTKAVHPPSVCVYVKEAPSE